MDLKTITKKLFSGKNLNFEEARSLFAAIFDGKLEEVLISSSLVALAIKGEFPEEIAAAVVEANKRKIKVETPYPVVDTCGTGGDGASTFNISTASALVIKALGIRVAKHGNRSVTGKFGSADIIEAFGIPLVTDPDKAKEYIEKYKFAFLFAPYFHPAFKNVAAIRKNLGIPTIFNILGPLINPADPFAQLIGFYSRAKMQAVAEALRFLGIVNRILVSSYDGLDEVSTQSETEIIEIRKEGVKKFAFNPCSVIGKTFAVPRITSRKEAIEIFHDAISGKNEEAAIVTALNAAFTLYAAEICDIDEGYKKAYQAIKERIVVKSLEELRSRVSAESKKN